VNIALIVILVSCGLSMYLLAREFFGPVAGIVAAAAYVYAPYTLVDLYVRGAYAEFAAFAFAPLILWALHKLAATGLFRHLAIAAIGYGLLLLCNNPASLLFTPILFLFALFISLRDRRMTVLLRGIASLLLGLMLSAFFWLPSLMETRYVQAGKTAAGFWDYRGHFVDPGQLVNSTWGYGFSMPGAADTMSFQIGAVHLALAALSVLLVFLWRVKGVHRVIITFFLFVTCAGAFMTTGYSAFVWESIAGLQYLQFPWRFLTLTTLATSLLCAVPFYVAGNNWRITVPLAGVLITAILVLNHSHARPERFSDTPESTFTTENIARQRIALTTTDEYRPASAMIDPPYPRGVATVVRGSAEWTEVSSSYGRLVLNAKAEEESVLRLNIHHFPGWKLRVDGNEVSVGVSGQFGLMDVPIPQGDHEVEAVFANTGIRTTGEFFSVMGWLVLLGSLLVTWVRRRKTSRG
jgi:hypothetical protein